MPATGHPLPWASSPLTTPTVLFVPAPIRSRRRRRPSRNLEALVLQQGWPAEQEQDAGWHRATRQLHRWGRSQWTRTLQPNVHKPPQRPHPPWLQPCLPPRTEPSASPTSTSLLMRNSCRRQPLSLLQVNVGRGGAAHEIALALGHERKIVVILIQEPYIFRERQRRITKRHPAYECFTSVDDWSIRPRVLTYLKKGNELNAEQARPLRQDDPAQRDLLF